MSEPLDRALQRVEEQHKRAQHERSQQEDDLADARRQLASLIVDFVSRMNQLGNPGLVEVARSQQTKTGRRRKVKHSEIKFLAWPLMLYLKHRDKRRSLHVTDDGRLWQGDREELIPVSDSTLNLSVDDVPRTAIRSSPANPLQDTIDDLASTLASIVYQYQAH